MPLPLNNGAAKQKQTCAKPLKGILLILITVVVILNYVADAKLGNKDGQLLMGHDNPRNPSEQSTRSITGSSNEKSTTAFWWPSIHDGGLLQKIYHVQNPPNCSSRTTKFLVWQSMRNHEKDTRGLTAWGHAGASHMLHAFTDGDEFVKTGDSRVLLADDKVWPMAKGCKNGPETRECYFEELTKCKLSDVDSKDDDNQNSRVLKFNSDPYDRAARTVYLTETDLWFRVTKKLFSWTGLPGNADDHPQMQMFAALLAYYFRPKPWLQQEIDQRIRASIPKDLDPQKTIGVPIRRSDKCKGHSIEGSAAGELDCPPLSKYLEGIKAFLEFDPSIQNVIVTSEDASAAREFLELIQMELPRLRTVQNVGDVQQGTGSGSKLEAYVEGSDNANVVASALTSLHLHLRANYFVITTKSTWTSTIAVMARSYGFASNIFVIDIGRNTNTYSSFARRGSP